MKGGLRTTRPGSFSTTKSLPAQTGHVTTSPRTRKRDSPWTWMAAFPARLSLVKNEMVRPPREASQRHLTDMRFCSAANVVTASVARELDVYRV